MAQTRVERAWEFQGLDDQWHKAPCRCQNNSGDPCVAPRKGCQRAKSSANKIKPALKVWAGPAFGNLGEKDTSKLLSLFATDWSGSEHPRVRVVEAEDSEGADYHDTNEEAPAQENGQGDEEAPAGDPPGDMDPELTQTQLQQPQEESTEDADEGLSVEEVSHWTQNEHGEANGPLLDLLRNANKVVPKMDQEELLALLQTQPRRFLTPDAFDGAIKARAANPLTGGNPFEGLGFSKTPNRPAESEALLEAWLALRDIMPQAPRGQEQCVNAAYTVLRLWHL